MTNASPPPASRNEVDTLIGRSAAAPWWRRPRTWIALAVVIAAVFGFRAWQARRAAAALPSYTTAPVERGDLALSVTANGTLQPTRLVNIGSELSGTVTRVLVDVNDRVKKGQVLVELDTAKLSDQIARSQATLASAQAKVAQAAATVTESRASLARLEEVARLSGGKVPSKAELDTARAAQARALADDAAARAGVADAQAALSTDRTNLGKASIRSPIDGVVLTRSVDPGNAVAAALQAVTLFTIAEDLAKLKLQVNVDEADVGAVRVAQPAGFTVSAYPRRRYPATITRVAYGSTTTDNVVTYVTTLDVDNGDLTLRPGMTATATIAATQRHGVLLVPNSALRFTPTGRDAMAGPPMGASGAASGAGERSVLSRLLPGPPPNVPRRPPEAASAPAGGSRRIWVLREGRAQPADVRVGISDGRNTEVEGGVKEGELVITDQRAALVR